MSKVAGLVIAASVLTPFACKQQNSNYCADVPVTHNCLDQDAGGSDAPSGCTSDPGCSGATPVCDLETKMCVQCSGSDAAACTGMTPICGSDDMCEACTSHSQCASDVCLPDGSCSSGSNVAYVSGSGSDNTTCSQASPCSSVADGLATARPYIKITGTIDEQVTIASQNVTMLADPGATLTSSSNGVILTVNGSSQVSIYDFVITGASGTSTGIGISIPAATTSSVSLVRASVTQSQYIGISASSGALSAVQSTLSGNTGGGISASGATVSITRSTITGNSGGGISLSSTPFTIVNNFIVQNGSPSSLLGGIDLASVATTGAHQLDFNTITANDGGSTVNSGINCGTVTSAVNFDSNIVYGNTTSGGGKQLGGSINCTATYSDFGPDTVTGSGNISSDPLFVNAATGNYHLGSGSPCIDVADPNATLDVDFDGDTRPQGSGRDIGADEYKP
jgi:hypothetical protein